MDYNLPSGFVPFDDLVICSNRLVNGIAPFSLMGQLPLLVGKGQPLRVWLQVPSSKSDSLILVDSNESRHSGIDVWVDDSSIKVYHKTFLLLRVEKRLENLAVIENLDLRPVGLDIYGTETEMYVGNMQFSQARMSNVPIMIGLG